MEKSDQIWNSRYKPIKLLGDGSFAEVYLFEDLKPGSPPRILSEEVISHIKLVSEISPEIEFVQRESPSSAHQNSVKYLQNEKNLFPQNEIYTLTEQKTEGNLVAIKVCKQNQFNDRDGIQFYALRELMILQHLQKSKYVVRLIDSFVVNSQICIVMEYLPDKVTKTATLQLVEGLAEIHDLDVCHRDLAPTNVRIDINGNLKYFDFGISKIMVGNIGLHTKNCVTRCYRPPEIFYGDRNYTKKVDIWSAACLIYELNTGDVLFAGTSDIEVICKLFNIRGTPKQGEWPECEEMPCYLPFEEQEALPLLPKIEDERLNSLLLRMLSLNPANRPTAHETLEILNQF